MPGCRQPVCPGSPRQRLPPLGPPPRACLQNGLRVTQALGALLNASHRGRETERPVRSKGLAWVRVWARAELVKCLHGIIPGAPRAMGAADPWHRATLPATMGPIPEGAASRGHGMYVPCQALPTEG